MAVIDLNTGELVEEAPQQEAQAAPIQENASEVINLSTGAIEEKAPAPTQEDFLLEGQPASALTDLTPEEAAELPEVGYLEDNLLFKNILPGGEKYDKKNIGRYFKLAVGSILSSDESQHIEIIQNVLPDAKINTFETGETVIDYEGQKFILNKPGMSATDFTRFAGQFVAFLPVGKISQLGKEGVKRLGAVQALKPIAESAAKQRLGQVAAAAAGSGAISAGLDVGASQMAGDESTQGVSKERAALSAVFGGGAELIGPAFRGVVRKFRGTPDDLKYIDLDAVRELKQAEEITGIRLLEPQVTRARADSAYMKILQDLPETQQQMAVTLQKQNQEAAAAVTNYLGTIADKKALITAPRQVRDLAVGAIDEMKVARSKLVEQGYKEAFDAGTMVDVNPLVAQVDEMLAKTSSSATNPVRKTLLEAKDQLLADAVDGKADLQILHSVKMNMDDAIGSFGEGGMSGQSKRALTDVKNSMVASMDEASPLYDQVKSIYRDASGPINEMQNSLVGKVSGIKDDNLKKVLTSIFDASESNPANLKQAKSIIESQDPDAWNQLLRAHLESNLGKIRTTNVEGVPNVPNQYLGALFGKNEIQRKMIMDSMNAEQKGSARWLETALKAASRGRGAGSDTAAKQEAIKTFKGEAGSLTAYLNPLAWPKQLSESMSQAKFERRASAFVDAMTNGEWSAEMMKLKQLNPTDSASGRALVQLLNRIETGDLDDEKMSKPKEMILPEGIE